MNRPREDTHDPGADRYFDGPPIVDSSGSVKVVGSTVRRNRDPGGRWKPRESRIVGPLNKPTGPGGIDTVTGGWIPGVRDNSQLHDLERVHAVTTSPYYDVPDRSGNVPPERKSHDHVHRKQQALNEILDCPACAASGGIPTVFGPEEVG